MDRTAGQFRIGVECPHCGTRVVFARNGEMASYTERFETFTRYGWDRVSYCPHILIDGGVMTNEEVRALASSDDAWAPEGRYREYRQAVHHTCGDPTCTDINHLRIVDVAENRRG